MTYVELANRIARYLAKYDGSLSKSDILYSIGQRDCGDYLWKLAIKHALDSGLVHKESKLRYCSETYLQKIRAQLKG